MVRKWFLLTPAGTLLLLLGIGFQALPFVSYERLGSPPEPPVVQRQTSHGMPELFHVTTDYAMDGSRAARALTVEWRRLVPAVLLLYLVAAAVGRAVTAPGRAWRPVGVILAVLCCVAAAALVAAMVIPQFGIAAFYDVGWPSLMLVFGLLGAVVALPITVLVLAVKRWRLHRRDATVGFPIAPAP